MLYSRIYRDELGKPVKLEANTRADNGRSEAIQAIASPDTLKIFTSATLAMFHPSFVRLSVCLSQFVCLLETLLVRTTEPIFTNIFFTKDVSLDNRDTVEFFQVARSLITKV